MHDVAAPSIFFRVVIVSLVDKGTITMSGILVVVYSIPAGQLRRSCR